MGRGVVDDILINISPSNSFPPILTLEKIASCFWPLEVAFAFAFAFEALSLMLVVAILAISKNNAKDN